MRQAFHLLGHPVPGERFESLHDASVQGAPPLLEEAPVGHLLGESVFEGIDLVGPGTGGIEELRRPEVGETQRTVGAVQPLNSSARSATVTETVRRRTACSSPLPGGLPGRRPSVRPSGQPARTSSTLNRTGRSSWS